MKIFCIIVTYNGIKWYDWCLQSLRLSTIPITPLIVDNGSTDDTINYIKTNYPEAILLPQNQNLGFGQANNKGIEYAICHGASHVMLLNQDAALQEDTIAKLLKHDDGHHLLTPIHLNRNGEHIDNNFHHSTLINSAHENNMLEDALLKNNLKESYHVQYVNAACWFLPVNIVKQIGGFNPLFYHYGEDNNYIHRILYHKFGIEMISGAYIYHDRKTFGNKQLYQKGMIYRQLLLIHTNINLTPKQRCIERYKCLIQNMGHSLVCHNFFNYIAESIHASFTVICNYKRIRNSRHKEITLDTNWLVL